MSWVNLDDVYVNKTGGAIAGNLSVGGALTINDAKGSGGTYNVANEITTLRDSVSRTPAVIAHTTSTSFATYRVDLSNYRILSLVTSTSDDRPLASTVFTPDYLIKSCPTADKCAMCVYPIEPNAYAAQVYYSNNILYIKSLSVYDKAMLIAF